MSTKLSVELEAFTPLRRNTLHGFATIIVPEMRLRINDISIHEKGESRWVGLPGKPIIDRDGQVRKDDRGKVAYVSILEFVDRDTREAFSTKVIEALLARYPGVFDQESAA